MHHSDHYFESPSTSLQANQVIFMIELIESILSNICSFSNIDFALIRSYLLIVHRIDLATFAVALKQLLRDVLAASQDVHRVQPEERPSSHLVEHGIQIGVSLVDGVDSWT